MPYYSFGADTATNDTRIWTNEYANTADSDTNIYYYHTHTINLQEIWDTLYGQKSLVQLEEEADWML